MHLQQQTPSLEMKGGILHPKETLADMEDITVVAITLLEAVAELVVTVEMKHPDLLIPML
jgi:hypothetical protein